jgi:hypothetical protein
MAAAAVAAYRPGGTFRCVRVRHDPVTDTLSGPCGAQVRMHGCWWCPQVCPACLAPYDHGFGADDGLYPHHGWYDSAAAGRIRANIEANGGQYVPESGP